MPSVSNVVTGKPNANGAVFWAPSGTTLPTDASTALGVAFKELGYVSEDGLTNSNSPETETVKAWGGDTVLSLMTGKPDTWVFTLIEGKKDEVLKLVYGASQVTTSTSTITVSAKAAVGAESVFVFDMKLSDKTIKRVVLPCAAVSAVGDIVYKDNEAVGYAITLTALPNSSGVTHYEYFYTAS